jgi:glycogen debranching enzyme
MVFQDSDTHSLYIRLAERLAKLQTTIDSYRTHPPFIKDLCLIDEEGVPLEFDLTTYPHAISLQTRLGEFGLVFQDRRTLAFGLPAQACAGLRFFAEPQFWQTTEHGGWFQAVRNLAYATNAEIVRNEISPFNGGYKVEFCVRAENDSTIVLAIGDALNPRLEVLPFSDAHARAETRWREWFEQAPPVRARYLPTYAYAWWIMANNLISPQGNVAYEAMTPSKTMYVGLWLWDSAMHTLAYRHVDPELACNQIRAMIACQQPDGMIPDAVYDEGVITTINHPFPAQVTKPPILTWAALKLHEMAPNLEFLQEIYIPMVRLNGWWFGMNDDNVNGLAQYNHPYSSGLDDSPLWDHGMPVESPDLNTYLCVQMGSLAIIAETLNMAAEGAMWRRRAAAIVQRMIDLLWDNEAGIFWALHDGNRIRVKTPFNLYPLWTGQLPDTIQKRLLRHLKNKDEFWGEYVLPTVARNDPAYDPDMMWRGPVWVNINYFFIEALDQIGEHALARELCHKTLDLIMSHPGMYEYYNSKTGEPPLSAAETFGWTAAVFIDLAIRASREEGLGDE